MQIFFLELINKRFQSLILQANDDHSMVRVINCYGDPYGKEEIMPVILDTINREETIPTIMAGDFNDDMIENEQLNEWDIAHTYPIYSYVGDRGQYQNLDCIITNGIIER